MVRASLNYVNWKERVAVVADLKLIYRASTEQEAERSNEIGDSLRLFECEGPPSRTIGLLNRARDE
jgi:transposase-like protein